MIVDVSNLSKLVDLTDAFIGTIKSFLKQDEIYKVDIAWLMYFLSKILQNNGSQEQIFLQGVIESLHNSTSEKKESDLSDFYANIKKNKNFLKKEFASINISDKYIIDSDFTKGIELIISNDFELAETKYKTIALCRNSSNNSENDSNDEYDKKLSITGMDFVYLYIFMIIWVVAMRNAIKERERIEIYLRLNMIFYSEFKQYLESEFNLDLNEFELNKCMSRNSIVRSTIKYIFGQKFNNKIESELFSISDELYRSYSCFAEMLKNFRTDLKLPNYSEWKLTINELKYAVSYWLLEVESSAIEVDWAIGNKNENFYYWIYKAVMDSQWVN